MTVPLFNYHTHTKYCDGFSAPVLYVKEAQKHNFKYLGFSGHAPLLKDIEWVMTKQNAIYYCNDINNLKKNNNENFSVLLGMEADYAPGISSDFLSLKNLYHLDYIIGSIHLVLAPDKKNYWFIDGTEEIFNNGIKNFFNNDIIKAVTAYYNQVMEMISTQNFDIVGHIDKININNKNKFFNTDEQWYKKLVFETLDLIKPDGPIVEINMRGLYKNKYDKTFPEEWIIKECKKRKIRITISSDAHNPTEINLLFDNALAIIKECGYFEIWGIDNTKQFALKI